MKSVLRKPWILLAILVVFSLAAAPLIQNRTVQSQPSGSHISQNASLQSAQDIYWVEIIVLNISDIDLTAGTYSLDFYIMLTCENAPCTYEPSWDILNTTSDFSAVDQGVSVPFEYYEYRVKADMIAKVDYSFYPFDYMYIEVFVEDKEHPANQLTYQFSSVSVDEMLFNPSGWFHRAEYDGGYTYQASYSEASIIYDRLDVWLFLERDWFGAFMKTIFAAIVIVMIGMLSFLMKADATSERLALTSSTLVAIVLYHISLVSGVPATGYLTFTDKFMVWTYLIVFISLVISVLMMVYVNGGQPEKAGRLHARTRWLIPSMWVLIMLFVFVKELVIPYNILISSYEGTSWWPQNLEWLANWLDYAKYLPDGYFQ